MDEANGGKNQPQMVVEILSHKVGVLTMELAIATADLQISRDMVALLSEEPANAKGEAADE